MKIKVITSVISTQSIIELISFSYDIDKIINCTLLQATIHDTYLIETFSKKYIFKIFKHDYVTKSEINFEIEFVNYLKSMQLNVSNYIQKLDNKYILLINTPEGIRYATLTIYNNGKELEYKNNKDAFLYGLNVGKLHKISKSFKPLEQRKEIDINKMFFKSITRIKLFLNNTKYLTFFENFENILKNKIKYIDFYNLKTTFCHGDLHGGNVNKYLNKINFYDFDFCGYGFISYDISVFRWGCMIGNRNYLWKDFIKGYRTEETLNEVDLENSLVFVAIRDLWVMSLYLNRVETMGKLFINNLYIENRIKFLKNIEEML